VFAKRLPAGSTGEAAIFTDRVRALDLTCRDSLQYGLDLSRIDLAGHKLERYLDLLRRRDIAGVDLLDCRADDSIGGVDKAMAGASGADVTRAPLRSARLVT
jgi:hypothetical protein